MVSLIVGYNDDLMIFSSGRMRHPRDGFHRVHCATSCALVGAGFGITLILLTLLRITEVESLWSKLIIVAFR